MLSGAGIALVLTSKQNAALLLFGMLPSTGMFFCSVLHERKHCSH